MEDKMWSRLTEKVLSAELSWMPRRILESLVILALLATLLHGASAQQEYNNTNGYSCSGARKACSTYALYRTFKSGETLTTVGSYFNTSAASIARASAMNLTSGSLKAQQPLYIPLACNCVNVTTQYDVIRTIVSGDTFWLLSYTVYGGLTTYQAIEVLNPNVIVTQLAIGQLIKIPIFCACPTATQVKNGTSMLLTYVVFPGETPDIISKYFGISSRELLAANDLSPTRALQANTTLLIPLAKLPVLSSISFALPPASAPALAPVPSPSPSSTLAPAGRTSQRPLYIGVAVGAFGMTMAAVMAALLFIKWCQKQRHSGKALYEGPGLYQGAYQSAPSPTKATEDKKANGFQLEMIAGMSDMVGSDKPVLFSYQELEAATQNFSEANKIQGSVYRGLLAGRLVAIKQMKGNMSQELKILCQVHHSNLVKLVGICVAGPEHLYLAFEYAENGSLNDCLCNQSAISYNKFSQSTAYLPWTPRVQIALDVASGLEYIHNYTKPSFVHKDLKSSNILLDGNFRAKVANFGMAKSAARAGSGPLLTRHITGTQGYMAPEYLEHGLVTPKADVFAFGVVLLEILSGKEAILRPGDGGIGAGKEWALSDVIHDVLDEGGENQMERVKAFMDPLLHNGYPLETACSVASLARTCVDADPALRPSMKDITFALSKMLVTSLEWESSGVFARTMSNVSIEAR